MIKTTRVSALFALSLFGTLSLMTTSWAGTTIKFGTVFLPVQSTWQIIDKRLAAVTAETKGEVTFDVGFDSKYAKVTETVEKVESGDLQMAYIVFSSKPSRFASTGVVELPLIRRTSLAGTRALCGLQATGMFDKDFAGLKVLATWALPTYAILLDDKRPVATPSDLRGLKIRAPGPTGGRALQKLGAIPVNLAISDMGKALASGMVQGIAYGLYNSATTAGVEGKMLGDQVTQILDIGFSAPAVGIFMSEKYFNTLPADVQQSLVRNLSADCSLSTEIAADRDKQESTTRDEWAKDGRHRFVTFDQAGLDDMRKEMTDVYDEWAASVAKQGVDGKALIEKARAIIGQNE
jgi:TRAP-type C4-dicarboxylate transport system substrate-binding protein